MVMYKILTLDKIDPLGLSHFPENRYETGPALANPDAVILRSFNLHSMELPGSIKAVARAGAGYNNIPVDQCTEQGIVVFNTPGANANGVKELILAGLFLTSRNITGGIEWAKSLTGQGDQVPPLVEKGKKSFAGIEILGKNLAVIGLGAIGVLVANAAQALGMQVVGYDPYISVTQAQKCSDKITLARSLESALSRADFVTLHIPLTPETKGFLNKEKFMLMKNGVRILNFARGELVHNPDLAEALEYGKVSWYITDFPNDETLKMKNSLCIPHLGASTEESETNCAIMAVDQIREYFEQGNIVNSVNFPNVEMDRSGGVRIVIAHRNIPATVSRISAVMAEEETHILNMMSKTRNDVSYLILDTDSQEIAPQVAERMKAIEGIFMVRVIE